jgi:hypothetical protein
MWKVNPPIIDFCQLYRECIEGVRDEDLRHRLELALPSVQQSCLGYEHAAAAGELHLLLPSDMVDQVGRNEMSWVYDNRMVRLSSPGRRAYDHLLTAPINKRCPLCGHRRVSTLDHHLPQSRYAAFTVFPLNLVPACKDCNKSKLNFVPTQIGESTLHPYFDDVEASRWLKSIVNEQSPVTVRFWPDPPETWPQALKGRVLNHFETFELHQLYALEAADEIRTIEFSVKKLFMTGGNISVQAFLEESAEACRKTMSNWWRTATYEALAASEWYCGGGFL